MSLPQDQIDRIVAGVEVAPITHRHLTYEKAISYFDRLLKASTESVPEWATDEIDVPRRDKLGQVQIDRDGYPVIDRKKISRRSVIAKPILEERARHQAIYRAWLSKSNDEHAADVQHAALAERIAEGSVQ